MREIVEIFVQFLVDVALGHDTFGVQNLGSEKLKLLVPIPRKIISKRGKLPVEYQLGDHDRLEQD